MRCGYDLFGSIGVIRGLILTSKETKNPLRAFNTANYEKKLFETVGSFSRVIGGG